MTDPRSLEERAASLLVVGFQGDAPPEDLRRFVAEAPPAGVIVFARNVASTAQAARLTRELRALFPPGSPAPLIALDQEGGPVRRLRPPACPDVLELPAARDLGRAGDPALTEALARVAASQLGAIGFNLDFAPVLDVDSNPANPVIGRRAFSADPEEVADHGLAFARGLLSGGVLPCGKHFPGHGDTDLDSHEALPRLPHGPERLDAVELLPFRRAVAAGLPALMSAHIVYEALDPLLPATLSPVVLPRLLREDLGFGGVVFSDDLEMAAIADHHDAREIARLGLRAGLDAFLVCRDLDRARALREAIAEEARHDAGQRARVEVAALRLGALRARAPDHAAAPWDGVVPAREEADALLSQLSERLAALSS